MVERLLPHTTDDDHKRYRSEEDIAQMSGRDPIAITAEMLKRHGILDDATDRALRDEAKRLVNETTERVEALPYPAAEDMYHHLFADPRSVDAS